MKIFKKLLKIIGILFCAVIVLIIILAVYNKIALKQEEGKIAGIVGLDMVVPYSYDDFDFNKVTTMITWGSLTVTLGLLRIPGIYPLNTASLSEKEITQQKLLMYRNAVNQVYINEGNAVYDNAQIVKEGGEIFCPMIMFSLDETEIGDF